MLSIFTPRYFPSLPLFAFQTPISSLALPAGKGTLCSHIQRPGVSWEYLVGFLPCFPASGTWCFLRPVTQGVL